MENIYRDNVLLDVISRELKNNRRRTRKEEEINYLFVDRSRKYSERKKVSAINETWKKTDYKPETRQIKIALKLKINVQLVGESIPEKKSFKDYDNDDLFGFD